MTTTLTSRVNAGARRRVLASSRDAGPLPWGKVFTPHLVSGAFSPLHDVLNDWHRRETTQPPGAMDAIAAPRGHGKSTGGVEVPALWHSANHIRRFLVISASTWSQATDRLATVISEVENNTRLRAAYPTLRPAVDDRGALVRWRDDDIVFANGVRIMAVGAGKSIRGARRLAYRPDLLLLDDLEDEASVATDEALRKRLRWITRVALGLASPIEGISALWLGTIISRSALLNKATGAALEQGQTRPEWASSWTPHVYSAETRGSPKRLTIVTDEKTGDVIRDRETRKPVAYRIGDPLWSEITRPMLARIRYKIGGLSYAAEYLSDPVDEGSTILAPPRVADYVNPTAPPVARIVRLPGGRLIPVASMTKAAALDPQYATKTEGNDPDLAAVVVAGQLGAETFLLDAWIGRDRHGQAAKLVDMAIAWGCYAAGVEATAAQAVTADAAAADGRIPVVGLKPIDGKIDRALSLAVRLGDRDKPETSRVFALPDAQRSGEWGSLLDFLAAFPHGRFDDPVDATVYAVELAARGTTRGSGQAPQTAGARAR